MFIQLMYRHHGVHTPVKHTKIPCKFENVYLGPDHIDEELLLRSIPEGWLPVPAEQILLTKSDKNGGTGQGGLSLFRNWAKYFDSYCLELHAEPLDWWDEECGG